MATTKSTVLGIRLDHERRAWVEAEAARLGLSVRGLFEEMIDEARYGETADSNEGNGGVAWADSARVEDGLEGTAASAGTEAVGAVGSHERVNTPWAPSHGPGLWPNIGSVTALPGGLIRGAFSLTAGLIESSAHCATHRLGMCALTRRWTDRSV